MVTYEEFVKRFGKLKPFIRKTANELVVKKGNEIVKMQQEQHHKGVNTKDRIMQTGYSKGYSKLRQKKGLQTRFVDLHFTGEYHKSLKVVPTKEGVDVKSDQDYEQYLRNNFPDMAGLTKDNADRIAELVANELAVEIKKYLVG